MTPIGEATRVRDHPGACDDDRIGTAPSLVEKVAGVVAGHSLIGYAHAALRAAGYGATIAGNRITVDETVLVQYIAPANGPYGGVAASWVIHRIDGATPVWIVGSECPQ
jgi:hypothetical protein